MRLVYVLNMSSSLNKDIIMSWIIDFNRFSGKAQVRRATLSCDSLIKF